MMNASNTPNWTSNSYRQPTPESRQGKRIRRRSMLTLSSFRHRDLLLNILGTIMHQCRCRSKDQS
ncbi:hypothetical protein MAR_000174, partial [Mya arenaria]